MAAGAALIAAAPAQASPWPQGTDAGRVEPAPLAGTRALGPQRELLPRPASRASRHRPPPSRIEKLTDPHGHVITIGTSIPGLDLRPIAAILAGTLHGDEVASVRLIVVSAADVGRECGGGEGVLACYIPDGRARTSGEIVVGHDEPDLVHSLVHEFGHHVDGQYDNLTPVGACLRSNDGTRRWFFERERVDSIRRKTGCSPSTPYRRLLGEVFAEDYAALNGIVDWLLPVVKPPAPSVLAALAADLQQPFQASAQAFRGRVTRRRGASRRFHLDTWSFVSATLTGSDRAGLDLYIFRSGARRPLVRSARRGSGERVIELLPPGDYDLNVYARGVSGRYRAALRLR